LETPLARPFMKDVHGENLAKNSFGDMSFQFSVTSLVTFRWSRDEFLSRICAVTDQILGSNMGLRHLSLGQDASHLLLLEKHEEKVSSE